MSNVRLRTIINQDNSTTFQVQFPESGEWEDLTWDMISDKPFETLDDTVFMVDENGVLTITDIHTVTNWTDVEDKPFIFLDPDDFTVSASGVLSYTGSLDWSAIVGKPFNTLDNNDFEVQNGKLSVKHQTIPNQTWSQIQNKPFTSLDPTNFQVVGGVLYLNINPEIPYWSAIQNKPFTYLDSNDFAVVGDTLKVKHQTIPDQNWSQIQQKPFETLDANDFTVDQQGKVKVNFPQSPTQDVEWDDVQNKPLSSLNSDDFTVDENGEASVNFPTPTPDSWQDVTGKPFESIGSGLSVDPDTKELSATGGGGNLNWSDVQNKPFNDIGTGLYVNDGHLNNRYITWMNLSMSNANKIANALSLKSFFKDVIKSALANKFNLPSEKVVDYFPMLLEGAQNYMYLTMRLDNTDTSLTQFSDSHKMLMEVEIYKFNESSSQDTFVLPVRVSGLLSADGSNTPKIYNVLGYIYATISKSGGQYTTIGLNTSSSNLYATESVKFSLNNSQPF